MLLMKLRVIKPFTKQLLVTINIMKRFLLTFAIFLLTIIYSSNFARTRNLHVFKTCKSQDSVLLLKKNILQDTAQFKNKQMKILLNRLPFPIKDYIITKGSKVGQVKGVILFFEEKRLVGRRVNRQSPLGLYIEFDNFPFSYKEIFEIIGDGKNWNEKHNDFFGDKKIKRISPLTN